MKREAEETQFKKGDKFVHPTDPFWEGLEHLAMLCGDQFYDDGKPREPFSLSITFGGDQTTVQMVDLRRRRSTTTVASDVRAALELLEDHIANHGIPWRLWGAVKK